MKRKEMDTSHSRPFKATVPGTPPNTFVKAVKRYTTRITVQGSAILGTPDWTDTHQSTTTLNTLLFIWDPFHERNGQRLQHTAAALVDCTK